MSYTEGVAQFHGKVIELANKKPSKPVKEAYDKLLPWLEKIDAAYPCTPEQEEIVMELLSIKFEPYIKVLSRWLKQCAPKKNAILSKHWRDEWSARRDGKDNWNKGFKVSVNKIRKQLPPACQSLDDKTITAFRLNSWLATNPSKEALLARYLRINKRKIFPQK